MRNLKTLFLWIGAGIGLGIVASFSPGFIFMAFVAAGIAVLLYRCSSRQNRRFLVILFLGALLLRVGASAGLDLLSWKVEGGHPYQDGPVQGWNLHISDKTRIYLKIGDSDYFSQRGYAVSQFVQGSNEPVLSFRMNQYGKHGYIYWLGLFYYLFGFSPWAVKLINCLLGALIAVLVFLLAQRCFSTRPARWAGILTAFFPSLVLWSTTNLKEIPLTFFTLFILFLAICLTEARSARSRIALFLLGLGSLWVHATFRDPSLSYLLAGSLLIAHLLARGFRAHPRRTTAGVLILLALGFALCFWEPMGYRIRQALIVPFNWHIGFFTTPGSSYTYLPPRFYENGYHWQWAESGRVDLTILAAMVQSVFYYLLVPFPWDIYNAVQLFSYPQMIAWYVLLPFSIIGIREGLLQTQPKTLALILSTIAFVVASSLPNGNVGTAFRLRDMVTPLFLILGCAGFHRMLPPAILQNSVILKTLSRRFSRWRASLEETAGRVSKSLQKGPAGSSWRDHPLRAVGISGLVALLTGQVLIPRIGQTFTDWERAAGTVFGALFLLALFHRGNWRQVIQGSRVLRFLQRT